MHVLVHGTVNPDGEPNSHTGVYLREQDLDSLVKTNALVGKPVKIEHRGDKVGEIVSAWRCVNRSLKSYHNIFLLHPFRDYYIIIIHSGGRLCNVFADDVSNTNAYKYPCNALSSPTQQLNATPYELGRFLS
jgi:hypothetical protein